MTSSRRLLALTVGAVMLATVMHSAHAIKCYQCNSLYDTHCADIDVNDTTAEAYLKECDEPDHPRDVDFFCRKIVQTLLYKENERRVIRKCGYEKDTKACYHFDDDNHAEVVCQCFEDGCNAAPSITGSPWRTALLSATSAALLRVLVVQ